MQHNKHTARQRSAPIHVLRPHARAIISTYVQLQPVPGLRVKKTSRRMLLAAQRVGVGGGRLGSPGPDLLARGAKLAPEQDLQRQQPDRGAHPGKDGGADLPPADADDGRDAERRRRQREQKPHHKQPLDVGRHDG